MTIKAYSDNLHLTQRLAQARQRKQASAQRNKKRFLLTMQVLACATIASGIAYLLNGFVM